MNTDVTLVVTIIVAVIAALSAIAGNVYTARKNVQIKQLELKHKEIMDLREKMNEPYSLFVKLVTFILRNADNQNLDLEGITEKIDELSNTIIISGSNKALSLWSKYRLNTGTRQENPKKLLNEMADVMFAMRKDLGFEKDSDIGHRDILTLFINDYDEM